MSVDEGTLGAFGDLAVALGILGPDGQPNAGWFADPVAGGSDASTGHGLQHVMADPAQRAALVRFVDETLGPPEQRSSGGQTWVPLFDETDPDITVYAVVDDGAGTGDAVHLGVGFTHTTAGVPPRVTTTVHVPLFRFAERDAALTGDGDTPLWLLLGREGGVVEVGVDAVLSETPPTPGEASLGGLAATVRVGTHEPEVGFAVTLRDLQLPGAAVPRTFTLDVSDATSPDELLDDVLDLAAGLVRAQADALGDLDVPELRRFAGLAGMLGLRDVDDLPPLPLADLPTLGVDALVGWAATVVQDDDARDAWLSQLALLVGAEVDPARDAVAVDLDPLTLTVGVRVETGTGGHPALVPWVEVSLGTRTGAAARAYADLFRVDTGTGVCVGFPALRLEGVFGSEAGGTALVTGTDPHVGGARLGLALNPAIGTGAPPVPVFHLTVHDVRLGGAQHDVLDLSSPQAALDAAGSVVGGALTEALETLGAPGELVADLLGLDSPSGVDPVTATALLGDPVAAVRGYWTELLTSAAALEETLGSLQEVLTGVTSALPGGGTDTDPWAFPLVGPLSLRLWLTGVDDPAQVALHAELAVVAETPVLGELTAETALRLGLVTLEPAAGRVTFADGATASVMLGRTDGSTTRLDVGGLALVAGSVGVELVWLRAAALTGRLAADDLALEVDAPARLLGAAVAVPIPLPEVGADGRLRLPSPDWEAVERALAALVARVGVPELDALVGLLGWSGRGPRLRLSALLDADPADAVSAWLGDLLLDCERVRTALGPVAALLSGFTLHAPLGTGNDRTPFRCPVAGEPRAPGVAVWVDPGCAVPPPRLRVELDPLLGADVPDMESVAAALRSAPVPDVEDLLVARDALGEGLDQLATRWTGSDGLVGEPDDLPDDVTGVVLDGRSYDELVALGLTGGLVAEVLDPLPAAVVHVGCEALWVADRPAGTAFDLSESVGAGTTLPAAGAGAWSVRLPTPAAAAADRPDRGGVGEQAARLVALLADRTDPVTVIGYGAAGAAVVRAASTLTADRPALDLAVVTVGTPYAEVATASLTAGLSGDALRLLALLTRVEARSEEARWSAELLAHECTPVQRSRMLTARSLAAARPDGLPPVATPAPGRQVTAVFGALDRDGVLRGIAAHAADGLSARVDAAVAAADAVAAAGQVTAVHAGLDLPVLDLTLGDLLVGAGVRLELAEVGRADDGTLSAGFARGVVVDLHLGVQGGWLVGGPGVAGGVGDLRWMSARVEVPFDGSPGTSELVLHEVRGLGIDRERWVVRAGDLPDVAARVVGEVTEYVDAAVPEVRLLLGEVAGRLASASSELGDLLELFGLLRADGFDADALDRLLHDPAVLLRGRLALDPAAVATALEPLVPGAGASGTLLAWTVGPATLGVDLGTGELVASLEVGGGTGDVADLEVVVTAGPEEAAARLSCGAVDPVLGGVQLTARAATGSGASAAVEWAAPGAAPSSVELWPTPDPDGVESLAVVLVPALGLKTLAATMVQRVSAEARPLLEQALAMLGMLPATPDGVRRLVLPLGLVTDPAAWFAALARTESLSLGPAGVALLDALAPLVVPDRGSDPGYPLTDDVRIDYADEAGRLRLTLSAVLEETVGSGAGAAAVATDLTAGVLLGLGALPQPVVSAAVTVGGPGLRVTVDPDLRVDLLRAAGDPLPLYPAGPGFGDLLDAGVGLVVPRVLDLVADQATSATGLRRDVGQLVADVGDALLLRESGAFVEQAVRDFAADPAAALLARLPALVGAATTALARALDPGGDLVRVTPGTGTTTLGFGALDPTEPVDAVTVLLDTSGPLPRVVVAATWDVPDLGPVTLEGLELSAAGVAVSARLGPFPVAAGPVALRPMVEVRAGTVTPGDRMVGVGLALDDTGDQSVQLRWGLDAQPPLLAAVTQAATPGGADHVREDLAPLWMLSLAIGLAGGVLVDGLDDLLDTRAARMLRGVVLTEAATSTNLAVDPGFALDLLEPEQLVARLERLLWNLATDSEPLSVTLDSTVTIGLAASGAGDDRQLGVTVTLVPGKRFTLAEGSVTVELDVDASWLQPEVTPGLTVYAVRGVRTPGSPATYAFSFEPGVTVAGLGLRFTNPALVSPWPASGCGSPTRRVPCWSWAR